MYGTVARAKVKAGRLDDVVALMNEWERDHKAEGAVANYLYSLDVDATMIVMAVVFRDKASYVANADDPETDTWYRRFRELLEDDPEWSDGEIVYGSA